VTLTARMNETTAQFDLTYRCSCAVTWQAQNLTHAEALKDVEAALVRNKWTGSTRVAHALLLELAGRVDEAYVDYGTALRSSDQTLGRAYCHERRAAYELDATRNWLRCGLRSMRAALHHDAREGGANQDRYRAACEHLERELAAKNIRFPPLAREDQDKTWHRACEHEQPAGLGDVNEYDEPLTDDVIEIERLLRAHRWADAIAAYKALEPQKMVDGIRYASRGVDEMLDADERRAAIEMQSLVVDAYVIYASWSSSGGEGLARTADVERERQKLRAL
jgi:hypothetical protein